MLLWYAKKRPLMKYRRAFLPKAAQLLDTQYTEQDSIRKAYVLGDQIDYMPDTISSQGASESGTYPIELHMEGKSFELPPNTHWKTSREGMPRLRDSLAG